MNSETVLFEVDGYPLLLPAESQLPGIKRALPHYGTNVGRLAARVARKYEKLSIIDIGANVGDTVATLRCSVGCPILCVEGCASYLELLHENLRQFSDVEVEESFVGGVGPALGAGFTIEKGTGYLTPSADPAATVPTRSIEQILERHPRFAAAKFWKIDTDGWDSYILQENIRTVDRLRPIVFFEYDPHFFVGALADGFKVFECLQCAGYHDVLFWENTGDFFLRTNLEQSRQLEDLHEAVAGRAKARYWDIAVFPKEDADLAAGQRAEELAFFRAVRLGTSD